MHKITAVEAKSPAGKAGVKAGEYLVKMNGAAVVDVLDYLYLSADERITLTLQGTDGVLRDVGITNRQYAPLGLEFEHPTLAKPLSCANQCVFCFIDQMPPGMRSSLYFKDDDYRLCFLYGNYVTLTNADEAALRRIVEMRLSPVNISVHTTNPALRVKMLANPAAGDILEKIDYFARNDLQMQAQIVLCPGYNDGEELVRTLADLRAFYPQISSVSIVDVGLTKYRDGLLAIRPVDAACARATLDIARRVQEEMLAQHGTRWVFCGDEMYIKANAPLPDAEFYEDFAQYENGVGFIAALREEFLCALKERHKACAAPCSIACGVSIAPYLEELVAIAKEKYDIDCTVYPVVNRFFGSDVTATGLLTGRDIIDALKGKPLGSRLLLSTTMLKADSDVLLDDITVAQIEKELNIPVAITPQNGAGLLENLID